MSIGLGAGEPDFDTPDHIKTAAVEAIQSGAAAKYTAVDGISLLKTAIQDKFDRENNLHYETDQILVSVGAKQALFNLLLALIEDGRRGYYPGTLLGFVSGYDHSSGRAAGTYQCRRRTEI